MKLEEIVAIANDAYYDDAVSRSLAGEDVGDTLARFIASEIEETYDPAASSLAQLYRAAQVIETAKDELAGVLDALTEAYEERGGR